MWSVGCIFAEMLSGEILFQGYSEDKQLKKIFSLLGTPDVKKVPFYGTLTGFKDGDFEVYPKGDLKTVCPNLDANGLDLLEKMLEYDPEKRISASDALDHPFFKDIDPETKKLYEE